MVPPPVMEGAVSAKIEQYRRGVRDCDAKAYQSPSAEIRDLWISVGNSYRFLVAYEERRAAREGGGLEYRPVLVPAI